MSCRTAANPPFVKEDRSRWRTDILVAPHVGGTSLRQADLDGKRPCGVAALCRSQNAPGQQRFEFIDSLRGLSCLLVVYMHAAHLTNLPEMPLPEALWLRWSITFIDPGKVGVLIFFVISGYVVPRSLQRPQPLVLRRFVINRTFRILPAFWASIGIAVLVMAALADREASMAAILGNAVLAPQLFSAGWILDVYWSLQVELVFYVLCLFLALAGQINRPLLPAHLSAGLLLLALLGAVARDLLKVPMPRKSRIGCAVAIGFH